jgi:hypothetical protein
VDAGRGVDWSSTNADPRATLFHIRDGRVIRLVNHLDRHRGLDRDRAFADLGLKE